MEMLVYLNIAKCYAMEIMSLYFARTTKLKVTDYLPFNI
jgi:hypothetical protein